MTTKQREGHTPKQIKDWRAYERVRAGGKWNMFDPNARIATGLSRENYIFCMKHYSALKEQAISKAEGRT